MSRWFRHYAGMMRDDKLVRVAIRSKQPIERVVWIYGAILESASEVNADGAYDVDAAEIAYFLRADEADIHLVFSNLEAAGHIAEGRVVKWGDRQFKSDSSADRQAAYRQRKRDIDTDNEEAKPSGDAEVTSPSRHRDAPETETELETEVRSPNGDCPSADEPKLIPEHVFEFYKELAASLGKPVPRDFTPERRQMVRARIAQHPLEDFQTVFAKCRDSPFLRGDKVRGPLSIDWLMKKGNFQKTLEGNYDG